MIFGAKMSGAIIASVCCLSGGMVLAQQAPAAAPAYACRVTCVPASIVGRSTMGRAVVVLFPRPVPGQESVMVEHTNPSQLQDPGRTVVSYCGETGLYIYAETRISPEAIYTLNLISDPGEGAIIPADTFKIETNVEHPELQTKATRAFRAECRAAEADGTYKWTQSPPRRGVRTPELGKGKAVSKMRKMGGSVEHEGAAQSSSGADAAHE